MTPPPGGRAANILVVCIDDLPSAVLGVEAPLAALAAAGRCAVRRRRTPEVRPHDLAWCDALVLVRGASPAELRLLREAKRAGRMVATYMDDDLERIFPELPSASYFLPLARPIATIGREADLVLVTSERLGGELARRHGIAPVLLRQPRPPEVPDEEGILREGRRRLRERGRVRIACFGSVEHEPFLPRLLGEPLRMIRDEFGDGVELLFCGAAPDFAESLGATTWGWEADYGRWRRRAVEAVPDIALAPLIDSPFHRMKYVTKYLEYGSLGAAGIYSRVPPYTDAVVDGETGLLCANEPGAWHQAVRRLVLSRDERERIGDAARADVNGNYSPAALAPAWSEALSPLLSHRAPFAPPGAFRLPWRPVREVSDAVTVFGIAGGARWLGGRAWRRVRRSMARVAGRRHGGR